MRLRDLVYPSRILLLTLGIALLATGCRSHRADDAKSGPEVIYARAQKAMRSSSYGEAIKQLDKSLKNASTGEKVKAALKVLGM